MGREPNDIRIARQAARAHGESAGPEPSTNGTARGRSGPSRPANDAGLIHLTDLGNCRRIVRLHGEDLRYCWSWKSFLAWDGQRWRIDATAEATRRAKDTIIAMYREAADRVQAIGQDLRGVADDAGRSALERQLKQAQHTLNWAIRSEAAPRINAALDLLRSEPGMSVVHDDLDLEPWLLNCQNGTLDLHTGELREHRREDLLTQLAPVPYLPESPCPAWEGFVLDIFEGDSEMVTFIQRVLGRCLTGDVSEHILPICHGPGANGKSLLLGLVVEVMGPAYAMVAPAGLLMARQGDRHPTELADLFRKRLVVATEPEQGCRLNESLIKQLTGADRVRARRMKENFWEFDPTHKVILQTNHCPRVHGGDNGMWRRLRLVPFRRTYWSPDEPSNQGRTDLPPSLKQDKRLRGKLAAERAGILRWLVEGCLEWQRSGLPLPGKVAGATKEYQTAQDPLAGWLLERCSVSPDSRVKSSALFFNYCQWSGANKEHALDRTQFGEALGRKFEKYTNNGTWYRGLMLRSQEEDLPD